MLYFGVNMKTSKFGLSLTRENYIHPSKKSSFKNIEYDDKYTSTQIRRALFNFDLNMKFFSCLDSNEFNHTLQKFLQQHPQFVEVKDLNEYRYKTGYYILVLDKYKQIYIGTTNNICGRIRDHWTKTKQFDRLIFGSIFTSRLSIDSFRPLDTTRIFVYPTEKIFKMKIILYLLFLTNSSSTEQREVCLILVCLRRYQIESIEILLTHKKTIVYVKN